MKTRVNYSTEDLNDAGEWYDKTVSGYIDGYLMDRDTRLKAGECLHAVVVTDDGRILTMPTHELRVTTSLEEMQQKTEYVEDSNN